MPTGIYQHHPCKEETKKKISEANKIALIGNVPWNKGVHTGIKPWLGKKRSEETIKKISEHRKKKNINENHPGWKGDRAGYRALHGWVHRNLGNIKECAYCGQNEGKIEWASISHHAKRDLNDYIPLCVACHREYDKRGRIETLT